MVDSKAEWQVTGTEYILQTSNRQIFLNECIMPP